MRESNNLLAFLNALANGVQQLDESGIDIPDELEDVADWITSNCNPTQSTTTEEAEDVETIANYSTPVSGYTSLVAGLTHVDPASYNGWDGKCDGCDLDAENQNNFCINQSVAANRIMRNSECTKEGFKEAFRQSANSGAQLLYVAISSHGGQVSDLDGDEEDGLDETVCLWDGQLLDDEMWELLVEAPAIKIVFFSDSCNSETQFRSMPHNFVKPMRRQQRLHRKTLKCSVLYIAGCGDGESSYGDAKNGGAATVAWLNSFKTGSSWEEWFLRAQKACASGQVMRLTELGAKSFKSEIAFPCSTC